MKVCPLCKKQYYGPWDVCLRDGTSLVDPATLPQPVDEPASVMAQEDAEAFKEEDSVVVTVDHKAFEAVTPVVAEAERVQPIGQAAPEIGSEPDGDQPTVVELVKRRALTDEDSATRVESVDKLSALRAKMLSLGGGSKQEERAEPSVVLQAGVASLPKKVPTGIELPDLAWGEPDEATPFLEEETIQSFRDEVSLTTAEITIEPSKADIPIKPPQAEPVPPEPPQTEPALALKPLKAESAPPLEQPQAKPTPPVPPAATLPKAKPEPVVPPVTKLPKAKPESPAPPAATLPKAKPEPPAPPAATLPKAKPESPAPPAATLPKAKPEPPAPLPTDAPHLPEGPAPSEDVAPPLFKLSALEGEASRAPSPTPPPAAATEPAPPVPSERRRANLGPRREPAAPPLLFDLPRAESALSPVELSISQVEAAEEPTLIQGKIRPEPARSPAGPPLKRPSSSEAAQAPRAQGAAPQLERAPLQAMPQSATPPSSTSRSPTPLAANAGPGSDAVMPEYFAHSDTGDLLRGANTRRWIMLGGAALGAIALIVVLLVALLRGGEDKPPAREPKPAAKPVQRSAPAEHHAAAAPAPKQPPAKPPVAKPAATPAPEPTKEPVAATPEETKPRPVEPKPIAKAAPTPPRETKPRPVRPKVAAATPSRPEGRRALASAKSRPRVAQPAPRATRKKARIQQKTIDPFAE